MHTWASFSTRGPISNQTHRTAAVNSRVQHCCMLHEKDSRYRSHNISASCQDNTGRGWTESHNLEALEAQSNILRTDGAIQIQTNPSSPYLQARGKQLNSRHLLSHPPSLKSQISNLQLQASYSPDVLYNENNHIANRQNSTPSNYSSPTTAVDDSDHPTDPKYHSTP
ncbi:hypothetical protein N7456_002674 [Penicillium angulare]|uniref:Uncharacterized protein n=1 Tax=Penicillium angulare TaxID=116970 RepID=A0A9W9G9P5_9EURO|nr:hypothetical protein N7456_002674 [Penicillium angulare]